MRTHFMGYTPKQLTFFPKQLTFFAKTVDFFQILDRPRKKKKTKKKQ